ncbi:ubiquitin protein ligase [Aureococcus anophagefferens]|nr:ubiquitin protein ligase [Aureococcus anophagefferens]
MARLLVAAAALAAAAAAPPPRLRGAQRAIAQTIPHTRHWLAGAAGDDPAAADDAAADDDDPSFVQGYFFPEHGAHARLVGYDGSESRPPDEQRFVLLRDSLAESGEAAWVCFVCAFENKAR